MCVGDAKRMLSAGKWLVFIGRESGASIFAPIKKGSNATPRQMRMM